MRKKILAFAFAAALLAGTVTPALAAVATVTTPTGDPTGTGSAVPPAAIVSVDIEADHADNTEDVADITVP